MRNSSADAEEREEPRCPICGHAAEFRQDLSSALLRESLGLYYQAAVPDSVRIGDYQLRACLSCTLEFAWPMIPGDASFYEWITPHSGYYPPDRWEWAEVRRRLASETRPQYLLEVGCGSGDFLESLGTLHNVTAVGLDTTQGSAAACHAKGLEVHAETLDAFEQSRRHEAQADAIVAFHTLEHVAAPKDLIAGMCRLLAPNGRIFVSTPYSPMSFEGLWFDPLNHPPHHMTRWNRASFTELARQLDLVARFTMPKAASVIDRVAESFNLFRHGPQNFQTRRAVLMEAATQPRRLLQEVRRQIARETIAGAPAANVILVELTRSMDRGGNS